MATTTDENREFTQQQADQPIHNQAADYTQQKGLDPGDEEGEEPLRFKLRLVVTDEEF